MKRLFEVIAVLIIAAVYTLGAGARTLTGIRIEVESIVSSESAFDIDIVFSDSESIKGGSAELYFDEKLVEIKSVSLVEKTKDEFFFYNNKGNSIVFSFNCFMSEQKSRIVRIRFDSLEEFDNRNCAFYIKDGCICRDSETLIRPEAMPSAEITLQNDVLPNESVESGEDELSKSKSESSEKRSDKEASRGANIIYIQEKEEGAPVSQTVFLSVLGTGAVVAGLLLLIRAFRKKKQ